MSAQASGLGQRYLQIIQPRRSGTHLHPTRAAPLGLYGVRVTVTQAVGLGWHRAAPSGRKTNMEFDRVRNFGVRDFIPAFFAFALISGGQAQVTKANRRDKESGDQSPHSK